MPRKGEIALYESEDGATRYHIEHAPGAYFGVENITAGVSLAPRTKAEIATLATRRGLRFVRIEKVST
jgi:hypothetical protein